MPLQLGDLTFEKVWAGNTTPVAVDGTGTSPRSFCGAILQNASAGWRYVRLFDKASAPTMGTDLAKIVIALNASTGSFQVNFLRPVLFVNGLWVSVTAAQPDNDNTAPSAGDALLNIFYQ